jgi:hypothetical protein
VNDQITKLLENNKLRELVMKAIQKLWQHAGFLYDNPNEYMEEYREKNKDVSLWEEAWWQTEICEEFGEIGEAFDKYVIQKMAKPYRLTLKELVEAFFDLTRPGENHFREFEQFSPDDCNNLYMVFVNYVMNHILSHRYSTPFPICMVTDKEEGELLLQGFLLGYQHAKGEKWEPSDLDGIRNWEESTIWDKNGVSVRLLRGADLITEMPGDKKLYNLLAVIEGEMSTLACSMLQNEMSRIIPTAIRSADLLQTKRVGAEYKVIGQIEPRTPLLYKREIAGIPWGEEKLIENVKPMIRQYLDAYYSDSSGKKDSTDRRIRNAVCLLIESHNQPNNAVGLALSITGIEALLGEKGEGIAIMLAERVGALLEPDDIQRNNATEFVKKLYNTRSRALHGELVETESTVRFNARHLAAAALDAMIFLKLAAPSYYDVPDTPEQLLKFLYDSRRIPGQPLGIKEYNVRELWIGKTAGKKDSSL